jgi:hypothetical protein
MSAARKRGAGGRAARGQQPAETASRRGDRQPGAFDGPASRGSASGPANSGRGAGSTAPSAGSGPGSPGAPAGVAESQAPTSTSRRSSQSGGPVPTQVAAHQGDPARDRPARFTDQMRNLDLPASFYNIDKLVSQHLQYLALSRWAVFHPSLLSFGMSQPASTSVTQPPRPPKICHSLSISLKELYLPKAQILLLLGGRCYLDSTTSLPMTPPSPVSMSCQL